MSRNDYFLLPIVMIVALVIFVSALIWIGFNQPFKSVEIRKVDNVGEWVCIAEKKEWRGEKTTNCFEMANLTGLNCTPEVIFTPTYVYDGQDLPHCALTDGETFPCDGFGAIIMEKGVRGW